MNKYLSVIFLYNRASHKKVLLIVGAIPLCFLAIFLLKTGDPREAGSYMLMERAFGGAWAILPLVAANLLGLLSVANSLNGRKASKAACSTTGYTMRRLRLSPLSAYLTIFVYYLAVILIFWGVAIVSLYAIGKMGLTMAGATGLDTKLALGLLRTEIGHALIPMAHPTAIAFNVACALALAGECARACYLRWHNGTPSAGVAVVIVPMFIVWAYAPENSYVLVAILIIVLYAALSLGDVISREKRPKGDPFKVNKYDGIVDLDSMEDDEACLEVNRLTETHDALSSEMSLLWRYGRIEEKSRRNGSQKMDLGRLRRRFMPLGINLEKANFFFGACVTIGVIEHMVFYGNYLMRLREIKNSVTGITIDSGMNMPYFWDLEAHAYYGYLIGILLALFLQAYWNHEYYNKKTKSVYVMKRLPDRKEYARTIWVAPIMQAVFIVMIMAAQTVLDFCLYAFVTPEVALHADYLSHILPF
ncbi:hypothetical protein D3Z38_01895 [Clostridiales bacterium]|nr:hypothetical protein [Clostridiales bacterium]